MNLCPKIKLYQLPLFYFIAISLGLLSGFFHITLFDNLCLFISDTFIKIFKLISLPIISLSLIVTIASLAEGKLGRKLWQRTLSYTLTTTLIAAMVSCMIYLIIQPKNINASVSSLSLPENQQNYFQYLHNLIPTNIFNPFLEYQVMSVLLISIAIGIAIRYIPEQETKHAILLFFRGLYNIFLIFTKWIIKILPIGLFGFIGTTLIQLRGGINVYAIGEFLSVIVLANLVQGFIVLPLWLKYHQIKPFHTMKKMMPALSIAFFSKSSAGTLPITMNTAEKNLGIHTDVSRFLFPLCTTINMNGCAAFIFATVIYLMQNQGIPITSSTLIIWIIIATIAAIGNAGVPMGCFFLSASLLSSIQVPILLLGIILPFYTIIDMVETALNVWSDSCVVSIVNKQHT